MYEEFEGNHTPYIASMKVSENTGVAATTKLRLGEKSHYRCMLMLQHQELITVDRKRERV